MGRKLGGGVQKVKEVRMKTVLFVVTLLVTIGTGAALLYKIGEVIVELQNTVCRGEHGRWRNEHEKAKEDEDGDRH